MVTYLYVPPSASSRYRGLYPNSIKLLTLDQILGTKNPTHGKMVIFKDFREDENHTNKRKEEPNSCTGSSRPRVKRANHCTKYATIQYAQANVFAIQDNFKPSGVLPSTSHRTKFNLVAQHLTRAANRQGLFENLIFMNYLSANKAPLLGVQPRHYARAVNPRVNLYLANQLQKSYVGFVVMDFPGQTLITNIIRRNFK
jgi:hypothetical protein